MNKILFISVFSLFIITLNIDAETADFLVLEYPSHYSIFNKYEQPVSSADLAALKLFTPFQLIVKNEQLSDGITSAYKVSTGGIIYYLLKDKSGNLRTRTGAVSPQIFEQCTFVDDTVTIIKSDVLPFVSSYISERREYFKKETELARLFNYRGSYCFRNLDGTGSYGWSRFNLRDAWKRKGPSLIAKQRPEEGEFGPVLAHMEKVNRLYEDYFGYFNKKTGQEKTVPRWHCEAGERSLTCTLIGAYASATGLEESSRVLVRDLEALLEGTAYEVVFRPEMIVIKKRV